MPICWGSKKAFKAQYKLEENGLKTHEAWLNWYRKKRDGQINFVGSAGEPYGNQNAQLSYNSTTDKFAVKIRRDLELMENADDKFLLLEDLDFQYQRTKLTEIIQNNDTPITTRILRRGVIRCRQNA